MFKNQKKTNYSNEPEWVPDAFMRKAEYDALVSEARLKWVQYATELVKIAGIVVAMVVGMTGVYDTLKGGQNEPTATAAEQ